MGKKKNYTFNKLNGIFISYDNVNLLSHWNHKSNDFRSLKEKQFSKIPTN